MAATVTGVLLTGNHAGRPSSGLQAGTLYSCTTHSLIYQTSDTGSTWATWANLSGTGAMATDTLWDAAGDIAVGTGANTAAKLTVGASGTVPASNGTTLAYVYPPGYEIDYVQITSTVNITGNDAAADTLITGNSVTLDGGTVLVEIWTPAAIPQATAGAAMRLWLFVDGTQSGKAELLTPVTTQAERAPMLLRKRITGLSAGSHQFIAKGSTTSGTAQFGAGAGTTTNFLPAFIRVTKV